MKPKPNKKAQITIFIIIAVVLLVAVAGYLIIQEQRLGIEKEKINPEIRPIYNFIQECVDETAEQGLSYIGENEGYLTEVGDEEVILEETFDDKDFLINFSFSYPQINTTYYIYGGENNMPSLERIEKELNEYMDLYLKDCVDNFQLDYFNPDEEGRRFPDYEIEEGLTLTKSNIFEESVEFSINYPISISRENKTYELEGFETVIPVRLGKIYSVVKEIVDVHIENPGSICVSCLHELSEANNMTIHVQENEEKDFVFVIRDKQSQIFGRDYLFYFLSKHEIGVDEE